MKRFYKLFSLSLGRTEILIYRDPDFNINYQRNDSYSDFSPIELTENDCCLKIMQNQFSSSSQSKQLNLFHKNNEQHQFELYLVGTFDEIRIRLSSLEFCVNDHCISGKELAEIFMGALRNEHKSNPTYIGYAGMRRFLEISDS